MGLQKRRAEEYFSKDTSWPATKRFSMQAFDFFVLQAKENMRKIFKKVTQRKGWLPNSPLTFPFMPPTTITIVIIWWRCRHLFYERSPLPSYHNIMYSSFFSSYKDEQTASLPSRFTMIWFPPQKRNQNLQEVPILWS